MDRRIERALQAAHVHASTRQQRAGRTIVLREQCTQQMLGFDVLIVITQRQTLRFCQRFLEPGGQFVNSH